MTFQTCVRDATSRIANSDVPRVRCIIVTRLVNCKIGKNTSRSVKMSKDAPSFSMEELKTAIAAEPQPVELSQEEILASRQRYNQECYWRSQRMWLDMVVPLECYNGEDPRERLSKTIGLLDDMQKEDKEFTDESPQ